MNQSEFLAITCDLLTAREKSRLQDAIGFGFASPWLKNWRETFKSITKRNNRNRKRIITFDSRLKTALKSKFKVSEQKGRMHSELVIRVPEAVHFSIYYQRKTFELIST